MNFSKNANSDKFYTKPEIALNCIKTLDLDEFDLIIEPSAGAGAFTKFLPAEKTVSFDLFPDPNLPETIQQDFLKLDLEKFIHSKQSKNVLIIGNPPYGRMSGLAMKFVKKSCINNKLFDVKTTVAFILSQAFAKESFSRRVPTTHSLSQHIHLGSPFTVDGEDYNALNTGWFVWVPQPRELETIRKKSDHICFHKKEEFLRLETSKKCAFRVRGSGAGQVFHGNFENLSETTTVFCTGSGIDLLSTIDWNPYRELTIGIPSISTNEIIKEIEKRS